MRSMSPAAEVAYREGLIHALETAGDLLARGGTALDGVTLAVGAMEQSGAFNAGRGSALSFEGQIEADAAVMDGDSLEVGAVAAVPDVTNGVHVARDVMTKSIHCLLAGEAAKKWAIRNGIDVECNPVPRERKAQWARMLKKSDPQSAMERLLSMSGTHDLGDTVGAVARDGEGRLAVAVSTGGIWLKSGGRVGDSPLIGSGFWADSRFGAVCATGTGEFIMRSMLVSRVALAMESGQSVEAATLQGLEHLNAQFGPGKAGLIAIGADGSFCTPFDTAGMGRGWYTHEMMAPEVRVWPEEDG